MAITSPTERLWWKEPLHRPEIIWIAVSFVWGLIMFFAMIYWHIYGEQNLSNEAYRVDPEAYAAKAEEMVAQNQVRKEGDTGVPVAHPPAGSDVYLIARLWEWWPVLELEKDKSYRLHISSLDWQHGFSLPPCWHSWRRSPSSMPAGGCVRCWSGWRLSGHGGRSCSS